MSQSFPSSNGWEPFSNSQQQHALGWRRPATKPALPAPPNPTAPRFPAISPWNHINRPSRTDPPSLSQPTPSPHDDLALSTAVTKPEQQQDTRPLQRYNALKKDLATVDTKIDQIRSDIDDIRQKSQDAETLISTELGRVHDQCRDLHQATRSHASAHDDHVRVCHTHLERLEQHIKTLHTTMETTLADSLQAKLSDAIAGVVQTLLDTATRRLTQHITSVVGSVTAAIQTNTIPRAPVPPPRGEETADTAPPPRAQSPVPLVLQIHSSDEEYALRVANRKRPPMPASSSSFQEADSLDPRHMHASDASTQDPAEVQCVEKARQVQQCSYTPRNQDSSRGLFEDSDDLSDCLMRYVSGGCPGRDTDNAAKSSRKRLRVGRGRRRGCKLPQRVQGVEGNCSQRIGKTGQKGKKSGTKRGGASRNQNLQ